MKPMKKTILILTMLTAVLLVMGVSFDAEAVSVDEMLSEALETDDLERAVPDSAENVLGNMTVSDGADYKSTFNKVWDYIRENGITEVLALYNIPNFCADISAARCFR